MESAKYAHSVNNWHTRSHAQARPRRMTLGTQRLEREQVNCKLQYFPIKDMKIASNMQYKHRGQMGFPWGFTLDGTYELIIEPMWLG